MGKKAVDIKDIKKEINYAKLELGLLERMDCSDEENQNYLQLLKNGCPLPEGIFQYEAPNGDKIDEFYRLYDSRPTQAELYEYLTLKQCQEICTIRKCLVTLTALAVIASAIGLWILFCLAQS